MGSMSLPFESSPMPAPPNHWHGCHKTLMVFWPTETRDLLWSSVKSLSPGTVNILTTTLCKSSNSWELLLLELTQSSALWDKPSPRGVTENNSNQLELTSQLSKTVTQVGENKSLVKNIKDRPGGVGSHKRLWKALRYFWGPRRLCAHAGGCLCLGEKNKKGESPSHSLLVELEALCKQRVKV